MIYKTCLSLLLIMYASLSVAQITATYTLKPEEICSSKNSLIVLSGHEIPKLSGYQLENLSLLSFIDEQKQSVVFQIDQKDSQGRYILKNNRPKDSEVTKVFGRYDELVFRKKDLGQRLDASAPIKKYLLKQYSLLEIKIVSEQIDSKDQSVSEWIYIVLNEKGSGSNTYPKTDLKRLVYDAEQDIVISPLYKIGFSKEKPFLLNAFYWRLSEALSKPVSWSQNVTDTMKIRHKGKFLGFPFKRSDDDYSSKLVAVKQAPLRIIRRTENKVKVFWKLKSPALYIDYVMMPDGFIMDTMIDIPFKISFFFGDLATITTMDWNDKTNGTDLTIENNKTNLKLSVNGYPSADKKTFNQIMDSEFSVLSSLGRFDVKLDIPDDFPLTSQLYLRDDLNDIDLPENVPGQFGNVGFKTTNWENIDSKPHHLKFTVCVDKM